jgi:hypothetical protein
MINHGDEGGCSIHTEYLFLINSQAYLWKADKGQMDVPKYEFEISLQKIEFKLRKK